MRFFISLCASIICFFNPSMSMAQTKWDMPTPYADTEFQTKNNYQFAEDVKKASNGVLNIQVHSANSLIKNPEIKRAVQTGQVQIGEIFKPNLGPEDPMFELDAIPFFAASYKEAQALLEVSRPAIQEKLMKQLQNTNPANPLYTGITAEQKRLKDNAVAIEMLRKKFLVINPSLTLKTWHFHSSELFYLRFVARGSRLCLCHRAYSRGQRQGLSLVYAWQACTQDEQLHRLSGRRRSPDRRRLHRARAQCGARGQCRRAVDGGGCQYG